MCTQKKNLALGYHLIFVNGITRTFTYLTPVKYTKEELILSELIGIYTKENVYVTIQVDGWWDKIHQMEVIAYILEDEDENYLNN